MAIKFLSVGIFTDTNWAPCGSGVFNITFDVVGVAAPGDSYDLELNELDPGFNPDELLWTGRQVVNAVQPPWKGLKNVFPPRGLFKHVVKAQLFCNGKCEVAGPAGTGFEQAAQVYGYAVEVNAWQGTRSTPVNLFCFEPPRTDQAGD